MSVWPPSARAIWSVASRASTVRCSSSRRASEPLRRWAWPIATPANSASATTASSSSAVNWRPSPFSLR